MNIGFRYRDQWTPPEAERVTEVAITRFKHVYEVDPDLMTEHVEQQPFPNWDTMRIVRGRNDHLTWMHAHFANKVISGEAILRAINIETTNSNQV